MKRIVYATGNPRKVKNLQKQVNDIASVKQLDLNITEIQGSIEEACEDKLKKALQCIERDHAEEYDFIVCEDGGLELDVFSGSPGVFTKQFFHEISEEEQEYILQMTVDTAKRFNRAASKFWNYIALLDIKTKNSYIYGDPAPGVVLPKVEPKVNDTMPCTWRIIQLDGVDKPMSAMTEEDWHLYYKKTILRYPKLRKHLV